MRWYFAPAPAQRLAAVRLAVGLYAIAFLAIWGANLFEYGRMPPHRWIPVGLTTHLSGPLPSWIADTLLGATCVLAIPFTLGWRFRITGPLFALCWLGMISYRHAWGMLFHTENLLTLHILVLGFSRSADAWAWDRRGDGEESWRYGWPLKVMAILLVSTYLLAGIAKVKYTGWSWGAGDVLRNQIAFDNLRKISHGATHSPLGAWLVTQGWVFPPLAALSLGLELGAPLALLHRKIAAVWAALAWGFHIGVLALMLILFAYPLSGVGFLSLFRAERAIRPIARRLGLTGSSGTGAHP